jgi:hypothetical protein
VKLRRPPFLLAVSAFAVAMCAAQPAPPPSIVRIELPSESEERQPIAVPTEPENTVEVDLPRPLQDWAGRGFTPDADKYAGDFIVEATRGDTRFFVTPVAAEAHRVLHVVLAPAGGPSRSVSFEFLPAPTGLAWRKVVLVDRMAAVQGGPSVSLVDRPPRTRLRESSPESEIGLIRTLRLMLNMTADGARAVVAANPALQMATFAGPPRSFGDFTILVRFAVRDSVTGALGICASVSNQTARRLLFDPESWVLRVGDRVYPIQTADFANELDPGDTRDAFLVLARGPDGAPTGLLPDNNLELSLILKGSFNPRPVIRMPLEGFEE